MSKIRKIVIVIAFTILAFKCNRGGVFTNGTYSSIVLLLCYTFISFEDMKRINKMSLSRYNTLKKLYLSMCQDQFIMIFKYLLCFMLIGIASEIVGLFFGIHTTVSFEARIKFFLLSYINLFILYYLQLVTRILYGKWIALVVVCSCVFLSIGQILMRYGKVTPFIFCTAYWNRQTILSLTTVISYIICIVFVVVLSILSLKKDRAI